MSTTVEENQNARDAWVESTTRLGGFRSLKKTTEAPYTTKVNYREHTSAWNVEPPFRSRAPFTAHEGGPTTF